jgi:nucleoid-associated protein YgaU
MGILDFVKDAGETLGLGRKEGGAKTSGEGVEEYVEEQTKANVLWRRVVEDLGLDVDDFRVQFDDGTATLTGRTASQEEREKIVLAVGNVEGVARVDDRLQVEEPQPAATFYTVERGDTLSAIARDHYGAASKYPVIFEANRPMLEDPDLIYPGQVLRIPALEEEGTPA